LSRAAAAGNREGHVPVGSSVPGGLVARDEKTGQPYLRLPLPDANTLGKIAEIITAIVGRS